MHQNRFFGWGSAPDPDRGAYSAPLDPLVVFKGPTSKGKEGEGEERREGEGRGGGERLYTPPDANSWLRHCSECGFRTLDSWIRTVIRIVTKIELLVPGPCSTPPRNCVKIRSQLYQLSDEQANRLGPLSFIVIIDDLKADCEVHKFVDDTTLSELIFPSNSPSNVTDYLSSLLTWTADNDMQLNTSKTKEMILDRIDSTSIPSLSTPAGPIQRVTTFKLLGLHNRCQFILDDSHQYHSI